MSSLHRQYGRCRSPTLEAKSPIHWPIAKRKREVRLATQAPTVATAAYATNGATWSQNFAGVWHMPDGTTLSATDSTANKNNGTTVTATATNGVIDGSATFSGSQRIVASPTPYDSIGAMTITVWVYPRSITSTYRRVVHKADTSGATKGFLIAQSSVPGKFNGAYQAHYSTTEYARRTCSALSPSFATEHGRGLFWGP